MYCQIYIAWAVNGQKICHSLSLKLALVGQLRNSQNVAFSCGQSGQPAEYIPLWPSLSWMIDLMSTRDKPCTKLVRSNLHKDIKLWSINLISENHLLFQNLIGQGVMRDIIQMDKSFSLNLFIKTFDLKIMNPSYICSNNIIHLCNDKDKE